MTNTIAEKDREIAAIQRTVNERDVQIVELQKKLVYTEQQLALAKRESAKFVESTASSSSNKSDDDREKQRMARILERQQAREASLRAREEAKLTAEKEQNAQAHQRAIAVRFKQIFAVDCLYSSLYSIHANTRWMHRQRPISMSVSVSAVAG